MDSCDDDLRGRLVVFLEPRLDGKWVLSEPTSDSAKGNGSPRERKTGSFVASGRGVGGPLLSSEEILSVG